MLDKLGIHVLHGIPTKKRNEMLPNVSAVIYRRGFSELTQHFPFPFLRELRECGRGPGAIRDRVNVFDPLVQLAQCEPFRRVLRARSDFLLYADAFPNTAN
jgi:hypothetical protein